MKTRTGKKILALFLAVLMVLPAVSVTAFAEDGTDDEIITGSCGADGDNVTYELNKTTGVLTISGEGDMADYDYCEDEPWYEYEEKIKTCEITYGVTNIGEYAFDHCSALTSIKIPDSVTSIGDIAFFCCSSLAGITIPDSVKSIGYEAFYGCSSLTSIAIPDSVASIGNGAFSYCSGIESITVDKNNTAFCSGNNCLINISNNALIAGCKNSVLTDDVTVESIGYEAFLGCDELTDITIPASVTSIGYGAFSGCYSLTSITIPYGVKSIGRDAFRACFSLTNITIPKSVESIGDSAFEQCDVLINITIPDSVTSIGNYAFNGCSALTSITIPDGVTSIGDGLFNGCSALTSITIPDGVISIGKSAFYGCRGLTSITIPDGVTSIGDGLFNGCSALTSITIPDSVKSIGDEAFYGCSGLKSITIPKSVTSIGDGLFNGCSALTSITIPDSVKSIGDKAFYGCSGLTSIAIPESVTSIGDKAFCDCGGLETIAVDKRNTKYSGEGDCLTEIESKTLIAGCNNSVIPVDDTVTIIGDEAFYGCSGLKSITIPKSVTSIGSSAFYGCDGLETITVDKRNTKYSGEGNCLTEIESKTLIAGCNNSVIPDDGSVTIIGYRAFYGCSGLTSIIIPDRVTSIGSYAFAWCSGLTSITIPDRVTSIGSNAFAWCSGLTSITIPDSVTSIGLSAFYGCNELTSITIPDSVTNISFLTFALCKKLTNITIPDSVTSIGSNAFAFCEELTSITIPDSVTSIGSNAFGGCLSLKYIIIKNKKCTIGNIDNIVYNDTRIVGYNGSTAEEYANTLSAVYSDLSPDGFFIPIYDTIEEVKEEIEKRNNDFTFYYEDKNTQDRLSAANIFNNDYENALTGDYMRLNIKKLKCTKLSNGGIYEIQTTYHTSYEQEKEEGITDEELIKTVSDYINNWKATNQSKLNDKTEEEKARFVYDYVCDNIIYPSDGENISNDSTDENTVDLYNAYSALILGKAYCQGYALAYYRLARAAGLDCRIVTNDMPGEYAHTWNIVKIDGKWYQVDAASGDSIDNVENNSGTELPEIISNATKNQSNFAKDLRNAFFMTPLNNGLGIYFTAVYGWKCTAPDLSPLSDSTIEYAPTNDAHYTVGGKVGNIDWKMDLYSGELTITGSGAIPDYDENNLPPWTAYALATGLKTLIIGNGITGIGKNAFVGCDSISTVYVSGSVKTINSYAFDSKPEDETVTDNVITGLYDYVFYCTEGSAVSDFAKTNGYTVLTVTATNTDITVCSNSDVKEYAVYSENNTNICFTDAGMFTDTGDGVFHKVAITPEINKTCTQDGRTEGTCCCLCTKNISGCNVDKATGEHTDTNDDNYCDWCGDIIDDNVPGPSFLLTPLNFLKNLFKRLIHLFNKTRKR